MNCEQVRKLLPDHQNGTLSPDEERGVRSHLLSCQECRKEDHLFSATWEMLASLPVIQPSPDFRARFWEKVRQEEDKKASWVFLRRWIPAAAGFLAIWVIGVGTGLALFVRTHSNTMVVQNSMQLGPNPISLETAYLKRMPKETI